MAAVQKECLDSIIDVVPHSAGEAGAFSGMWPPNVFLVLE